MLCDYKTDEFSRRDHKGTRPVDEQDRAERPLRASKNDRPLILTIQVNKRGTE
jgi:hypothetical protein